MYDTNNNCVRQHFCPISRIIPFSSSTIINQFRSKKSKIGNKKVLNKI